MPVLMAETFRVTLDRNAHVGGSQLKKGEYRVTVDGSKAEFQSGDVKASADVREEKLETKNRQGYVRYSAAPENRITEIAIRGSMVRWLFP
jgi:hypothetical protein